MKILNPAIDIDHIGDSIRLAVARLLMLDYDGCLAPFTVNRDRAFPYDGISRVLTRLQLDPRNTIVIITGRGVADILPLLDMSIIPEIWGAHGWERRHADGRLEYAPIPPEVAQLLAQGHEMLSGNGCNPHVEWKRTSISIHWRGLSSERKSALAKHVRRVDDELGLHMHLLKCKFDGGVEFRLPGRDKGSAVRTLIHEHPLAVLPAYLGDDQTDEDAFRALSGRGVRVLVRPEFRPTQADLHLVPPAELLTFLKIWDTA